MSTLLPTLTESSSCPPPLPVPPSVSLLQTRPSSPVSCHAAGFYPDTALVDWTKDGERLYEDVDHGETLQNPDGTFQRSVRLDLAAVRPEEWARYACVVQHSSSQEDIVVPLEPSNIRSNWGKTGRGRGTQGLCCQEGPRP